MQAQHIVLMLFRLLRLLFCRRFPQVILDQSVHNGRQRHGDQDAGHPEEALADDHRSQHQQPRQSDGGADHARVDQVAFHLLQHQEEHDHHQALEGIDHRHEERRRNAADPRAEDGDQRRYAHQQRYGRRMRETEDQHADEAHHAEDHSLQQLTADEAGERAEGKAAQVDQPVVMHRLEEPRRQPPQETRNAFLVAQHVDGHDQREHNVHNGCEGGHHRAESEVRNRAEGILHQIQQLIGRLFDVRLCRRDHLGRCAKVGQQGGERFGQVAGILR